MNIFEKVRYHYIDFFVKSKVKKEIDIDISEYGSKYAGYMIANELLSSAPTIMSVGIGTDISFDLAMIEQRNARVFGFDPTPKSIDWLKNQDLPDAFKFFPYGIAKEDGTAQFFLPQNEEYVSGSVQQRGELKTTPIDVEMRSFVSMCHLADVSKVDVLKMDVEGSEFECMDSILNSGIPIKQICIEIHGRNVKKGVKKSLVLIRMLGGAGFKIAYISDNGEDFLFVNSKKVQ